MELRYRNILRRELERRCSRNSRYSLRAFARDLGLSPSHLSGIFSERYGLSRASAESVAKHMGLSAAERRVFVDLIESEDGRSQAVRKAALARLKNLKVAEAGGGWLSLKRFQSVADWFHFAILELTYLKDFRSDVGWIARSLRINSSWAHAAIERMKQVGLIKESAGRLAAVEDFSFTGFDIPSESIKAFHGQLLDKARRALHGQAVERRHFHSTIVAIRRDRLADAKAAIERFQKEFCQSISETGELSHEKDEVYCLTTQFFSLTENQT